MIPDLALDQMTASARPVLQRLLMTDVESLRLYAGTHEKHHDLFRCISKRFSFAILLRHDTIEIYAVLDCRRDPTTIESRLRALRTNR